MPDGIFKYEHPYVCTDAVIFTINTQESDSYRKLSDVNLRILLYHRPKEPYQNKWCLPGGFLNIDEMPENNIRRKILEKSHVDQCYLEQLYTFCGVGRDPRARVISLSYLGLMNEDESKKFEHDSTWFTLQFQNQQIKISQDDGLELSEQDFGFDHYEIMNKALERLQSKIIYSDIIFHLLPQEFTLTQLQSVHETILGKKEQVANFRRKIGELVQETDRFTSDKGHRPARLFQKKC